MPKKILIVDKLRSFIINAKNILERAGYKTLSTDNGLEALKLAFAEGPDLIISELDIPSLKGDHLCRLLKNNIATQEIPFILLTNPNYNQKRFSDLQIEPDEYFSKEIIKGLESPQLIHIVETLINKKRRSPQVLIKKIPETPLEALSLTNKLLDNKLYEATILKKILLSKNTYKYEETIVHILGLLGEIIDSDVATLFIKRMNTAFMAICLFKPVSDKFIEKIKKNIFSFIQKEGIEYDHEYFRVKIFHDQKFNNELPLAEALESYIDLPLTSRNHIRGILALGSKNKEAFPKLIKNTFGNIIEVASTVLDNVFIYEQIRTLEISDSLTGLYNHRYFQEKLEEEFIRAKRYKTTFSLIIIDIDNFKTFNEIYGFKMGDLILKEMGYLIYHNFRIMDIPARYGGKKFSLILPETDLEGTKFSAERLRVNTQKHTIKGLDKFITISIGFSEYSPNLKDKKEFLNQVETALKKAKELGKNKVVSWKEIEKEAE
ncbi:diguanylate cyclase [bacterium]|nr:diguanylate cyclase [bacterium]MBU1153696.1 diguanylate cyclase [bacterium]